MSEAAVNALRIVLGSIEAAKVRGIVLFILAALAGYGFYSAMVPGDDLNRASCRRGYNSSPGESRTNEFTTGRTAGDPRVGRQARRDARSSG